MKQTFESPTLKKRINKPIFFNDKGKKNSKVSIMKKKKKKESELEARLLQLKDRIGSWENMKHMNRDFSNLSQDQVKSNQKLKS